MKLRFSSVIYDVLSFNTDFLVDKRKTFEFNSESKDWHERGIGMFKLNKSKIHQNIESVFLRFLNFYSIFSYAN